MKIFWSIMETTEDDLREHKDELIIVWQKVKIHFFRLGVYSLWAKMAKKMVGWAMRHTCSSWPFSKNKTRIKPEDSWRCNLRAACWVGQLVGKNGDKSLACQNEWGDLGGFCNSFGSNLTIKLHITIFNASQAGGWGAEVTRAAMFSKMHEGHI